MVRLEIVPKDYVSKIWPQMEDWVKSALGIDRSYKVEDIQKACESGSLMLWKITKDDKLKGFLTTALIPAPQGMVCYAPWLGGEDLGEWVSEGFDQLKVWLRHQDCLSFSWIGRKAWQKLVKADSEQCFYMINL